MHFLTIPMKVYNNASSEILHDPEDNHTLMKLMLDIPDKDVVIKNNWELTKFLNEIMFQGSSLVHAKADLDIIVQSLIGELMLTGLKTQNDVIVH